jgi:hypothetical protein
MSTLLKLEDGLSTTGGQGESLEHYLYELYTENNVGWKLKAFYLLKPAIPRPVQLALRKKYRAVQDARSFPAWPIEPTVVNKVEDTLRTILQAEHSPAAHRLSFWPDRKQFTFVITHDVEWDSGMEIAPKLIEIEKKHGVVSCWNIVPERYPIDWSIVDTLRAAGSEIGVHGLTHDGKLFQNHRRFQRSVVKIHEYAQKWGAEGFRSPSMLRNVKWMPELKFRYDSSFPDTDPYEPQPGGCCSIWPYFIGDLVELPTTMPQDHTLFEILGHKDISTWKQKADWIETHQGLVLVNVHPDYMNSDERLRLYEELLIHMKAKRGMWQVLPREVAQWWRDRSASSITRKNGRLTVEGPAAGRAHIIKSMLQDNRLKHEILN